MSPHTTMQAQSCADDMLPGAAAIAAHIGKTERQTQHLIERRQLPVFKIGNIWHGYAAFVERLESAAMAQVAA